MKEDDPMGVSLNNSMIKDYNLWSDFNSYDID